MNQEQIASFIRQVLLGVGGAAVSKGLIAEDYMTMLVGVIMFALTSAYGVYVRRRDGLITSAAAQSGVKNIEVTRETEMSSPTLMKNSKVVSK